LLFIIRIKALYPEQISRASCETDIMATWRIKERRIKWRSHNAHSYVPISKLRNYYAKI